MLIALPVFMGLLALPFKKKAHLLAIVGVNTIVLISLSIFLVIAVSAEGMGRGDFLRVDSKELALALGLPELSIHELILYLDLGLLAFFVALGLYIKSPVTFAVAICQLVPLASFELRNPEALETFAFALDHLSLVFVLICSIVGSIIAIYGVQYMADEKKQGVFFFFILTFLGVMNGAVLSNNLIYLYFFWECTTLCCYFLIKHEGDPLSLSNAKWALEVTIAGGAALLIGAFMFHQCSGTASFSLMGIVGKEGLAGADAMVALPLFFFSLAAFTKAAQVPFQSWLLGAMVAPTPVSALLHSSTMVKLGVYLVIRIAPVLHQFQELSLLVAIVGGLSFLSTALLAIQERGMKKLLALSTVGNLGLIIMLAAIGTPEAIAAAVVLTIFHAISKALLFLSAGAVQKLFGRKDIEGTEGLFRRAPSMFGAFFIGILTMFLAPFGIFIAKYTSIAESTSNPFLLLMVLVGSIACEVFYIRWLGRAMALTGEVSEKRVSPLYTAPMWTLAVGAVALSVLLPFFLSPLVDPIAGFHRLEATLPITYLGRAGAIPTFVIFLALLLGIAYATMETGGKRVKPYTCGMEGYELQLSCPYFESYIDSGKAMLAVEVAGILTLLAALGGALVSAGVV